MSARKPYVSVVFGAYNQDRALVSILLDIDRFLGACDFSGEIVVVNNASTDRTHDILRLFGMYMPRLRVVTLSAHQHQNVVMRRACEEAMGDWMVIYDQRYSLDNFHLFQPYMEKGYHLIGGIRQPEHISLVDRFSSSCVRSGLFLEDKIDHLCDMYCFSNVLRETVFNSLPARRMNFYFEVLALATSLGYRFRSVEIPAKKPLKKMSLFDCLSLLCNTAMIRHVLKLRRSSAHALVRQSAQTRDKS